mmetsp:Transcript_23556/g.26155  ORF Transcript_23556/g.26155 Transcript_23556/m.26155 type:complete len:218 (-) Transcript_23556:187-840(-)
MCRQGLGKDRPRAPAGLAHQRAGKSRSWRPGNGPGCRWARRKREAPRGRCRGACSPGRVRPLPCRRNHLHPCNHRPHRRRSLAASCCCGRLTRHTRCQPTQRQEPRRLRLDHHSRGRSRTGVSIQSQTCTWARRTLRCRCCALRERPHVPLPCSRKCSPHWRRLSTAQVRRGRPCIRAARHRSETSLVGNPRTRAGLYQRRRCLRRTVCTLANLPWR